MSKNKYYQPNTTQIPNFLIDFWMSRVSSNGLIILLCICRLSTKMDRKFDGAHLNDICKKSCLSQEIIKRELNELLNFKIIDECMFYQGVYRILLTTEEMGAI